VGLLPQHVRALSRSTGNSLARGSRLVALRSQLDVLERRLKPAEGFIDHVIAFLMMGRIRRRDEMETRSAKRKDHSVRGLSVSINGGGSDATEKVRPQHRRRRRERASFAADGRANARCELGEPLRNLLHRTPQCSSPQPEWASFLG
jgi:hypothetical protein